MVESTTLSGGIAVYSMKTRILFSLLLIGLTLWLQVGAANAEGAATIIVQTPWLRATPKGAPVAGGYATIANHGTQPDRLIAASLVVAPTGEIHSMSMKEGVMHMERLDHGLEIKPGGQVTLSPGSDHLMFLKPARQLNEGEKIEGSLVFEKAGTIAVVFSVASMAAKSAPGMGSEGMDMKGMGHM